MKETKRIRTDVATSEWGSPFAVLKNLNLPSSPASQATNENDDMVSAATKKNRGRVDILRQTAHRGGKTVTVVTNFTGVSQAEQKQLSKVMQKACGAGGTTKEGRIEIQGDHRETVARILIEGGFRPVFAGG
jgi:translation initiation factor 1